MRIDLGAVEARVPKHFLHHSQVRATIEQVRGCAVPKRVGAAWSVAWFVFEFA